MYMKVQKVPKCPRGTQMSKRYLNFQEDLNVRKLPKGPRGTKRSKRYLKVQEVPKGPRGI